MSAAVVTNLRYSSGLCQSLHRKFSQINWTYRPSFTILEDISSPSNSPSLVSSRLELVSVSDQQVTTVPDLRSQQWTAQFCLSISGFFTVPNNVICDLCLKWLLVMNQKSDHLSNKTSVQSSPKNSPSDLVFGDEIVNENNQEVTAVSHRHLILNNISC